MIILKIARGVALLHDAKPSAMSHDTCMADYISSKGKACSLPASVTQGDVPGTLRSDCPDFYSNEGHLYDWLWKRLFPSRNGPAKRLEHPGVPNSTPTKSGKIQKERKLHPGAQFDRALRQTRARNDNRAVDASQLSGCAVSIQLTDCCHLPRREEEKGSL